VSVPLDSFVFLALAFGWDGLDFFEGQVVAKFASTLVFGLPVVLAARRLVSEPPRSPRPVPEAVT
jgi:hypothetical protein